jgi:hypothetical protein
MRIAHVVNPFKAPSGSEPAMFQPITFESIRIAKEFAQTSVAVEVYAVCYEEDREIVPDGFTLLPSLTRSVLDTGSFSKAKKYPLVKDIFQSLANATNAEYLIFTNMDISLLPQFYLAVSELLHQGYDALLINRRGISKKYKSVAQLPLMYSDYGVPHPGFDCFVFKRELLSKLVLEDICVGVSFSEVALLHNFIAFAENLKLVDELHLTFHIGTEVMPPLLPEYYLHNRREYEQKIYPQLKPYLDIRKFPYSELSLPKRLLKWALNPSFRTHQVLKYEGINGWRACKYRMDSWRFALMGKIK